MDDNSNEIRDTLAAKPKKMVPAMSEPVAGTRRSSWKRWLLPVLLVLVVAGVTVAALMLSSAGRPSKDNYEKALSIVNDISKVQLRDLSYSSYGNDDQSKIDASYKELVAKMKDLDAVGVWDDADLKLTHAVFDNDAKSLMAHLKKLNEKARNNSSDSYASDDETRIADLLQTSYIIRLHQLYDTLKYKVDTY